ncbi:hypothetical protein [Natronorubrum sulfidifaciens]|uniref:Uncharacterized protein n=1 Tax=Natronorubrum sulfidifaciens JCM 14089 TaxID=1230460 RepID=L9VZH4_9EURY|nr:hypothetical protein [Natronorubrum sulfidifaciens]ELY42600.1 hypothetical protein C495_14842 [Natronorubrum sulfidifaciens JCM 14089]
MTGYYDIVLGLIPVALLGITAALTVVGVSLTAAVPVGSVVAIAIMGHAMFVNAPADGSDEARSARPPTNAD